MSGFAMESFHSISKEPWCLTKFDKDMDDLQPNSISRTVKIKGNRSWNSFNSPDYSLVLSLKNLSSLKITVPRFLLRGSEIQGTPFFRNRQERKSNIAVMTYPWKFIASVIVHFLSPRINSWSHSMVRKVQHTY